MSYTIQFTHIIILNSVPPKMFKMLHKVVIIIKFDVKRELNINILFTSHIDPRSQKNIIIFVQYINKIKLYRIADL